MSQALITDVMKVWQVIQQHPETFEVFRAHGCPNMRKGIFAISACIMKVKWAARAHKIPEDVLIRDLNTAISGEDPELSKQ